MNVSVSHLNNRLALQLPAQLPLGLVFVLGEVERLVDEHNGRSIQKRFELVEKEHQVRCILSERVALEVDVEEGDTIRAGGHLVFDSTRADYYLLVRDVEIVPPQSPSKVTPAVARAEMTAMLADVRKRAESAKMVQSDLPPWVKKMAPAEFREEITDANSDFYVPESNGSEAETRQLAQLSAAMDSDEDVELTSGLLEVAKKLNQARGVPTVESGSYGMPPPVLGSRYAYPTDIEDPDAYTPTGKRRADYILILVIIVALMIFLMIFLIFFTRGF